MNTSSDSALKGHPISVEELPYDHVYAPPLQPCGDHLNDRSYLERLYEGSLSALIVRGAFSADQLSEPVETLRRGDLPWGSPNRGMAGGELRTLGEAATPCFTAFTGPSRDRYLESAQELATLSQEIFADLDPVDHLADLFSELGGGVTASPPRYQVAEEGSETLGASGARWLPFNYRALDPGVQIYSHHDNHYRLPIYEGLGAEYDRASALSWFVTLQAPESGGVLTLYGLWGSDPNPPMLPTRFMDTEALERDYHRVPLELSAGDLLIINSGRNVHRVTPVEGSRPRFTLGGFMTLTTQRDRVAFWS